MHQYCTGSTLLNATHAAFYVHYNLTYKMTSAHVQFWMHPQQWPNLSAFTLGQLLVWKRSVLSHFCSQEPPGLPSTSFTPSQQLVSGEDMWLLPKHSLLLLLSTHSVENDPNGNSENPQPNRLISMKKLFARKKRARGNMQWLTDRSNHNQKFRPCVYLLGQIQDRGTF